MKITLIVTLNGTKVGLSFGAEKTIAVGCETGNTIQPLAVEGLSRRHAKIYEKDTKWMLEDIGSTNGTYRNGEKIEGAVELAVNDTLQFGKLLISVDEIVTTEIPAEAPVVAAVPPVAPAPVIKPVAVEPVVPAPAPVAPASVEAPSAKPAPAASTPAPATTPSSIATPTPSTPTPATAVLRRPTLPGVKSGLKLPPKPAFGPGLKLPPKAPAAPAAPAPQLEPVAELTPVE
ncbi:MAG: FHA domain-containing protein [Kiritimatiellae bacterium]|nr:FHA domain-containing protein [Kiritimatiellia bacterium]